MDEKISKEQYFIFKDTKTKRIYLEHIHAGKYDMIKDWINKARIVYQTNDLKDPKLTETGEKEIIWERHADQFFNQLHKVIVPFNPNNYDEMETFSRQKIFMIEETAFEEKNKIQEHRNERKTQFKETDEYKQNIENIKARKKIANSFISEDADEMTAMYQWWTAGFIMPPPDRIREIKQSYEEMSWKQFKDFINAVVCSK